MIALIDADSLLFQATFNVDDDDHIKRKLDDLIESIKVATFSDEVRLAIKGEDNFRYKLFPDYKGHRKGQLDDEQVRRLSVARERALEMGAVPADGMEADDLVARWAYEMHHHDNVVCHIDKDLDMITGEHYNYHHNKMKHYTVTSDEADYNFHLQLLMGDDADNIKCLHGIGPKKAAAILSGVDQDNRLDIVKSLWMRRVPDWQNKLLIAGNLLWLRRYEHDYFTFTHEEVKYEPEH